MINFIDQVASYTYEIQKHDYCFDYCVIMMIYLIDQFSVIIVLLSYGFAKMSIMKYDISAIDVELIKEKKIRTKRFMERHR